MPDIDPRNSSGRRGLPAEAQVPPRSRLSTDRLQGKDGHPAWPTETRFSPSERFIRSVVAIDGDVKNSTYADKFFEAFPERSFECYIAEQNMVGMGIGLAAKGYIPFIATFAAFLTRAHDQIRMAAYSFSNIKLCGSHVGVSIGEDGPSQMGLEDLAIFRSVPGCVVLYPERRRLRRGLRRGHGPPPGHGLYPDDPAGDAAPLSGRRSRSRSGAPRS